MTKFSFEVPLKHLNDFHDLQDFYFTLSLLYPNETYREHLRKVKKEGLHTIWLDNSYNEKGKADEIETLFLITSRQVTCSAMTYPTRLVAPDSPAWDTKQISDAFQAVKKRIPTDEIIVVVRNQEMYLELKHQGAMNFAVSYHSRREGFTTKQMYKIEGLHFLGFLDHNEIKDCQPASCDTSIPVKIGMKYWRYDDWVAMGSPHIHTADLGLEGQDFFNATMTPLQIKISRDNIKRMKEECNERR